MQLKWYVFNIRPTREKEVSDWLTRNYIEHYFPVQNKANDHPSGIEPLFTACMFIRASLMQQNLLRTIPGILCFRYWLGRPATVRDEEIEIIRTFLLENPAVTVKKLPVNVRHRQRLVGNQVHEQSMAPGHINISRVILPSIGYMILKKRTTVQKDRPHPDITE